jgi:polyhydroxybutyrate depolymerase
LPVVFALHGFAGNGHGLRSIAVWEPIAEREKFLVVYPDGSSFPLRWNIGPVANIPTVDDVGFIRDVIADLAAIAPVDRARVYVTGFSNGGQMTHRIACRLADQVAAVGIVDGFDAGMLAPCDASRPVPLMAFFGTDNPLAGADYPPWFQRLINVTIDETEPPLPANAIELWLAAWAERNECGPSPSRLPAAGNASGIRYEACADDAEVIMYSIEGQGHAWPGGPALPLLGGSVSDINASEVLWAFFKQHPLPDSGP